MFIAAAAFFVAIELCAYPFIKQLWILRLMAITAVFLLTLVIGRRAVLRGQTQRGVMIVSVSLLSALTVLAIVIPWPNEIYVTLSFTTGALVMSRFSGRRLRALLIAAWSVAVFCTITGTLLGGRMPADQSFLVVISVFGVAWTVALGFVLLAQQTSWLQTAISQQKQTNSKLLLALEEQRRAELALEQKNELMEEFIYTISHHLRSPLVTSAGFLCMAEEDLRDGALDDAQSALDRIKNANKRMTLLLDDLLALSRAGKLSGPPEPVDVGALLTERWDELKATQGLENIEVKIASDTPVVSGIKERLRQVFDNLINNAILHGCPDRRGSIEVSAEDRGARVEFRIIDRGPGIAEEQRERIFSLFERSSSKEEGTGAGLAIVRRIVELHQGRVWVEETSGGGTTFKVELPKTYQEG